MLDLALRGIITRSNLAIVFIAASILCMPAFGQTTAMDWLDKGLLLYNQSKYDEAIEAYDRAIEIDPQLVFAWLFKGRALYDQGRYVESIKAYDKVIEI